MSESMADVCVRVYKRIGKAAKKRKGVRLSADEVLCLWNGDDAIRSAAERADNPDPTEKGAA